MARAINRDFEDLKNFLTKYSLQGVVENVERLNAVRSAHKCYLPFLQFWAILSDHAEKGTLSFYQQNVKVTDIEFTHLRETISDVGSGLFCCLHGAYKPGHMALRSGIENYLRFAAGRFDRLALTTTSIYDLFDIAKKTEPFNGSRNHYLGQLRASYSELCKFTHSATLEHMAGIRALAHFPSFNEEAFKTWQIFASTCMNSIATVTLLGQPSLYLDAHFAAKELLDQLIPQSARTAILKGTKL
jgi:hypothetical protein